MTTTAWMSRMNDRHVLFERLGDKLRVECHEEALAAELRPEALARKHEILAILDNDWDEAVMALLFRLSSASDRTMVEDLRLQFLERAAISEFDGGLGRAEADNLAYTEIAAAADAICNSC